MDNDDINAAAARHAARGPDPAHRILNTQQGILDSDDQLVARNLARLAELGEQPRPDPCTEAGRAAAVAIIGLARQAIDAHPGGYGPDLAADILRRQILAVRALRQKLTEEMADVPAGIQWWRHPPAGTAHSAFHSAQRLFIAAVAALWDENLDTAAPRAVQLLREHPQPRP